MKFWTRRDSVNFDQISNSIEIALVGRTPDQHWVILIQWPSSTPIFTPIPALLCIKPISKWLYVSGWLDKIYATDNTENQRMIIYNMHSQPI